MQNPVGAHPSPPLPQAAAGATAAGSGAAVDSFRMLPQERSTAAWLASIYALRMFGMFMILPIFAVHAAGLPGGDSASLVGLAMGMYGLTQAAMQMPLGWASDRLGRKPVILAGLVLFALGCVLGVLATTVQQLAWARALQGAGAISAALTALLADHTREEVRSKGMAMIGASIGVTFALSLVLAPVLYRWVGLGGLFAITGGFSLAAMAVVLWRLPGPAFGSAFGSVVGAASGRQGQQGLGALLLQPSLWRLNAGIFVLHLTQMAVFVAVPHVLQSLLGLPLAQHWWVYLPVLLGSFVLMVPGMVWAERRGQTKPIKLFAIGLMACVLLGLALLVWGPSLAWAPVALCFLLFAYFVAFNLLEAVLPSWVSRVAPPERRGAAMGVYNTAQALGLFTGGALGGMLYQHAGARGVFLGALACVVLWLLWAAQLPRLPVRKP